MAYSFPDWRGRFGDYGGRFAPEVLIPALSELEFAYSKYSKDPGFKKELQYLLKEFAGRPTPVYMAENLSEELGVKLYLKREDLNHTGAHKLNNTLGQALLAKKMGKKRLIAETGAGQHGVATATAAAALGMECEVYMGREDTVRQRLNVFRMQLLGTNVITVDTGSKTLKDAVNEAMRDWATNVENTYYLLGSCVGPHPYPMMVRDFQSVIGKEVRKQMMDKEGRLPEYLVACVGGGSNAIGLFYPFLDTGAKFVGVEAGGKGLKTKKHAASLCGGSVGVLHGAKSYVLQDKDGQITPTHSVSAGLDYPGVGPEHALLKHISRASYHSVTDTEALEAFKKLSEKEGIIPALESAHALAWVMKNHKRFTKNDSVVMCLSGRGDKDVEHVAKILGKTM